MIRESEWRREWEALRAEREIARRRWRRAADGLAAKARDPLGLGAFLHDHPVLVGGIGAAIAAILARKFFGRRGAPGNGAPGREEAHHTASPWAKALREHAMRVAVPLLLRMLGNKFRGDPEPDPPDAAAPADDTPSLRP